MKHSKKNQGMAMTLETTVEAVIPSSLTFPHSVPQSASGPNYQAELDLEDLEADLANSDVDGEEDDYVDSPRTLRSTPAPDTVSDDELLADDQDGVAIIPSVATPSRCVYRSEAFWQALARQAAFGGFTIRLQDGARPQSGWAVGFQHQNRALEIQQPLCFMSDLTAKVLEGYHAILTNHWAELSHVQAMSGWVTPEGNLRIEGMVVCDNEPAALSLARMTGQDAVYNLATGETIPAGPPDSTVSQR